MLLPLGAIAEPKAVEIGPGNLHPTEYFASTFEDEIHQLTVTVAKGYTFTRGPDLGTNPKLLWTKSTGNEFIFVDAEGAAKTMATVRGAIAPIGGGGKGGGNAKDLTFEIKMLTRYFSARFVKPANMTWLLKDSIVTVELRIDNALGKPTAGTASYQSALGAFLAPNTLPFESGVSRRNFTITSAAGSSGEITAILTNVDIGRGKKATGQASTSTIKVFDVDPKIPMIPTVPNPRKVQFDDEDYGIQNGMQIGGIGTIVPPEAAPIVLPLLRGRLVQNVVSAKCMWKRFVAFPDGKFYYGLNVTTPCLDASYSGQLQIREAFTTDETRIIMNFFKDLPGGRANKSLDAELSIDDLFRVYFQVNYSGYGWIA